MFRHLLARVRPHLLVRPLRKAARAPVRQAPLQAYDHAIDALEHRGAGLRRTAASMLALRGALSRTLASQRREVGLLASRLSAVRRVAAPALVATLERDLGALEQEVARTASQLSRTHEEAESLLAGAAELQRQLEVLRGEREEASLILHSGQQLGQLRPHEALLQVEQLLALDAARDEVARLEALIEVSRDGSWAGEPESAPPPGP